MKRIFAIVIFFAAIQTTMFGAKVKITKLSVEQQTVKMALATAQPRFSWQFETSEKEVVQTSYRIVVASTFNNAKIGMGDLWDSKMVNSSNMLYIPYNGTPLKSRDKAFWKVYATLSCGVEGKTVYVESGVEQFEISLLDTSDWQAKWIGLDFKDDVLVGHTRLAARYLRKDFMAKTQITEARLYICGLGQYSAYINGKEVAEEDILKPALSDYNKRVYFNTYDVTKLLKRGSNAIGVVLEGGRYTAMRYDANNPNRDGVKNMMHYGRPLLLLQLEITYRDGKKETIISDGSWKITNDGPIRTANEFDGETYNARMDLGDWTISGYDERTWYIAQEMPAPKGLVEPQPNPNIRVQEILTPVAINQKDGSWILDMGQNMVGNLQIKVKGQAVGDTITLRFAETLLPDGSLCLATQRAAEVTDRYISNGYSDVWHPMFVYHGFRYVEITGLRSKPDLSDFEGRVFYDAMPVTGKFQTSNEIVNSVYQNAYWGIRGNYRSMPTDCPQRDERMGWNGDRTTGNYGESYIFGNNHLYSKWLTDADDSQLETGSLPDVMPAYWRFYNNSMTWPGAIVTVADMLYHRFGDIQPAKKHYKAMKKWLIFMKEQYMVDGIMTKDKYGDWCLPPESPELIHSRDSSRITKAAVLSTPFYCYLAGKMALFADTLGNYDDAAYFRAEVAASTKAFNEKYLDTTNGWYDNNTVTANVLPLAFGMVPEEYKAKVFENMVRKTEYDNRGHVSTGVVGIQQLMRTLTDYGRGDLAWRLATNETYPSWGYMYRNGATTIWELWNGNTANPAMNSGNHVMLLGDLIIWEYEYLAGIRPAKPGYKEIELKPHPVSGLDKVDCSYNSVSGLIKSSWQKRNKKFIWDFTIPANTTATVYLPTKNGYEAMIYGSGTYHLTSEL